VTPNPSSDGDVVREEAASIAATQVSVYASVDVAVPERVCQAEADSLWVAL
jgi:hypothetical protein